MHDSRVPPLRFLALVAVVTGGLLSIVGSGEGFSDIVSTDDEVDLSGSVQDEDGTLLENVLVQAFLEASSDTVQVSATTDAAGEWTFVVPESESLTRRYSLVDYATLNTPFESFAFNTSGLDIEATTSADAEAFIDTAFDGLEFDLADKAWLAIDVVDAGGNEVDGATVSVDPDEDGGGATLCNGSLTGSNITAAAQACVPARDGPMVLFYFDAGQASVDISVSGITGTLGAPVRLGQITVVTAEQTN